jgi:methyltransferase FkbM-like protein
VVAFDNLLDRLGIAEADVVKLDVEGAEFELLESAARLKDVVELIMELHPAHPDAPPDVDVWLHDIASRAGLTVTGGSHSHVFVLRHA